MITVSFGRTVSKNFQGVRCDYSATFDPSLIRVERVRDLLEWMTNVTVMRSYSQSILEKHRAAYTTIFADNIEAFVVGYTLIAPAVGELVKE